VLSAALGVVALTAACGSSDEPAAPVTSEPSSPATSRPSGSERTSGTGTTSTTIVRGPGGSRVPGTTTPLPSADVPNAELEATVEAAEETWIANPSEYRGQPNARVAYDCSADGDLSTVWGVEVYTDDSSVCSAAVHAGLITLADGGRVVVEIRPGQDTYEGSAANGVTTLEYASWPGSFVFPGV
jgi:hypothetical protein